MDYEKKVKVSAAVVRIDGQEILVDHEGEPDAIQYAVEHGQMVDVHIGEDPEAEVLMPFHAVTMVGILESTETVTKGDPYGCDNGDGGKTCIEYFNGEVVTQDTGQGYSVGTFDTTFQFDAPTVNIVFNGQTYNNIPRAEFGGYGAADPTFSDYPFVITPEMINEDVVGGDLMTPTAGTHTLVIEVCSKSETLTDKKGNVLTNEADNPITV